MRYMEKPNINEVLRKELMRDGESDTNSERKKDRSKKKKKNSCYFNSTMNQNHLSHRLLFGKITLYYLKLYNVLHFTS